MTYMRYALSSRVTSAQIGWGGDDRTATPEPSFARISGLSAAQFSIGTRELGRACAARRAQGPLRRLVPLLNGYARMCILNASRCLVGCTQCEQNHGIQPDGTTASFPSAVLCHRPKSDVPHCRSSSGLGVERKGGRRHAKRFGDGRCGRLIDVLHLLAICQAHRPLEVAGLQQAGIEPARTLTNWQVVLVPADLDVAVGASLRADAFPPASSPLALVHGQPTYRRLDNLVQPAAVSLIRSKLTLVGAHQREARLLVAIVLRELASALLDATTPLPLVHGATLPLIPPVPMKLAGIPLAVIGSALLSREHAMALLLVVLPAAVKVLTGFELADAPTAAWAAMILGSGREEAKLRAEGKRHPLTARPVPARSPGPAWPSLRKHLTDSVRAYNS